MGKKYYGGIGTDKGFVMGSSDDELHNGFDDEFHTEGSERSANRNGRPNSTRGTAQTSFTIPPATTTVPRAAPPTTLAPRTTTTATTATTSWTTSSRASSPLKPTSRSQSKACSRRSCHVQ